MNAQVATAVSVDETRFPPAVMVALAGSFLANMTAQFASANLADIQGGLGASADEASWITTVYTVASFVGIAVSPVLLRTLGLRRYFIVSAAWFAVCAWLCAMATSLPSLLAVRALQGLAGGTFGPMAFAAVFLLCKGTQRLQAIALLSFVLLVSANAGPVVSGPLEAMLGWRALFLAQFWAMALLALAALRWMPVAPVNREGLRTHWPAIALFALASGALMLVLSQGARRFWLESPVIAWSLALAIGAAVGFAVVHRFSTLRILDAAKVVERRFGLSLLLNLLFRSTFAVSAYLIPLLLVQTQSARPLDLSQTLAWSLLPQIATFPLAWRLLHRVDSRVLMAAGVTLLAGGVALAGSSTSLVAGEQLRASLVLIGVGQMLFAVPNLVVGALTLKPQDGPTATIAFNLTTLGGMTLGTGLLSHFTIEREKQHSSVLVEHASWLAPDTAERLSLQAAPWSSRFTDDLAGAASLAQLGGAVRRQAWVLAANDAFALMAAVALLGLVGIVLLGRCPPLSRSIPGAAS
ncbi:MFS transporter [Lysobacter sp. MMG2]|uniref:MFS transporter n=1 Tax=Lysobacter sp. MMG2 TaxID=2801338 RepID=UPI001C233CE0|nr:MFS transporter [Lysobacter sp. MMG2]MBU8976021.1 MFS transporter [Lysobacter sp. MMG2]